MRLLPTKTTFNQEILTCDLENVQLVEGNEKLVSNGHLFQGIETRSSQLARSGTYSSKLSSDQIYGLGYNFSDAKAGDRFLVSAWRKGPKLAFSYLTVSIVGKDENRLYRQEAVAIDIDENDWEKLEMIFEVPDWYAGQEIKIYSYLASNGVEIYFDDFSIQKINKTETREKIAFGDSSFQHLKISIKETGLKKLEAKRQEAMHRGILFSGENDWVSARINSGTEIPAKLRLKGDWMDHLKGDKWSFRIKAKNTFAWNRMITFSVQNPKTRNFLSEWVYHYLLEKEDILTPRFDFIHLSLNGEPKGIYAYEEHFEKQLAEYKSRREGPIVKFSEEGVWNARKRSLDYREIGLATEEKLGAFEAAKVEPFKESKVFSSPALTKQFAQAQTLMNQYRFGEKSTSDIFDVEKLATYYAIIDLTKGYHSLVWHNQRFYFNPVTTKLEPIGFDGFTEKGLFSFSNQPFLGATLKKKSGLSSQELIFQPFSDPLFVKKYVQALDRITQKTFVDELILDIEKDVKKREEFLRKDFPNYSYQNPFHKNAAEIRRVLFPLNNAALRAHKVEDKEGFSLIKIRNTHVLPIEIIGYGKNLNSVKSLNASVWLNSPHAGEAIDYKEVTVEKGSKYLFFRLPGLNKTYHSSIATWSGDRLVIPSQHLFENAKIASNELYEIDNGEIRFQSGKFIIKEDIIIPAGYRVKMVGGTELNFINGAKLISKSPVYLTGEPENPIKIYSSDHSANGFTILQAEEQSQLSYVSFEDFNTLNDRNWTLTGAVTFYESDVEIDNCAFLKAHCEDGLNIVRSEFKLTNSLISESAFDGFDADFCKGEVSNTRFFKPGNDGMDFSGSIITVRDSEVDQAVDKGISIGEEATVNIVSLKVSKSNSGLVAKDLSKVRVGFIELENCITGFSAYQKKPEFGGANISVSNYSAKEVRHLHLVEKGSV